MWCYISFDSLKIWKGLLARASLFFISWKKNNLLYKNIGFNLEYRDENIEMN